MDNFMEGYVPFSQLHASSIAGHVFNRKHINSLAPGKFQFNIR